MNTREQLEQAMAALEAQRAVLGEAAVEAALAGLRQRLAALQVGQVRKLTTILFADVSGFTAMSETLDAEVVSDTMNALWQRLDAAIVGRGGRIDKHIGDAVMAVWGAEIAHEDDAEQAIRAALNMQAALAAFRTDQNLHLTMRIGINTGPVIFGAAGTTGELTALGDAVNLASRLEHAAPVSGILISHDTYRYVRGVFDVLPQALLTVKGKREPVRTYVVERAKPRAFRLATRGVEGMETRTIGRDAERLAFQTAYGDVLARAQARGVTVVGEAGVGKSRLLYEFENWLELLPDEVLLFKGRATPEMMSSPYSLVRDLFRFRFEILDNDSAAIVREKFESGTEGHLQKEQAHLAGHLVGFDFSASPGVINLLDSESFGRLAQAYLINYFRSLTTVGPVVLLLEDLHWADNASLDFVTRLIQELPSRQLLIVGLARPTLYERRPTWGEGPPFARLTLNPLSAEDSGALVDEILQKVEALPPTLRELIAQRAEGNPFYVEELIKMLIEDGVIARGEPYWRVVLERLQDVRVPPTLAGVLQARLDSLPPDEKEMLQRASVVGRLFWDAVVAALHAEGDRTLEVRTSLAAARARELVFRRERSAFAGAEEYIFKHAILHDVTYEMVLLKLRRTYHTQVADWLIANSGERVGEYVGLIAEHCERAGNSSQAVEWLRRAGEAAFRTSAYRESVTAYERALRLAPADDKRGQAELLTRVGNGYGQLSDQATARAHLEAGLKLAREVDDSHVAAEALIGLSLLTFRLGAYQEAHAFGEEARALAQAVGNRSLEALALQRLAVAASYQGEPRAATHYNEASLALYRELGNRHGIATCLTNMGIVMRSQGDYATSGRYHEESLGVYQEIGDRWGIATSLNNLGAVAWFRNDYPAAARHFQKSLELYQEIGNRWGEGASLNNLGGVAEAQGDYVAAARYFEASLAIRREIGDRGGITSCLVNLGHAAVGAGDERAAHQRYREALAEGKAIGALPLELEALVGLAGLYARSGESARSAELIGLALGHPASDSDVAKRAEPVLAALRASLPEGELEVALARGKARDLEQVVAEMAVM